MTHTDLDIAVGQAMGKGACYIVKNYHLRGQTFQYILIDADYNEVGRVFAEPEDWYHSEAFKKLEAISPAGWFYKQKGKRV